VLSRISIYDEKIKTSKDNIEANRRALRQMDEAVDQSMARSTTEQGANRAVSIRQSQARERTRLQNEIVAEQKNIAKLNDEAAPIRAEVRKVEAEVGPLKYIAAFIYGETDETLLEKAVTWVIITIIVVFDPLAVIMLLAAQMTFGWRKEEPIAEQDKPKYQPDDGPLNNEQLADIKKMAEPYVSPLPNIQTSQIAEYVESHVPSKNETPLTALGGDITAPEEPIVPGTTESELDKWNKMLEEAEKAVEEEKKETEQVQTQTLEPDLPIDSKKKDLHDEGSIRPDSDQREEVGYVQNAEQSEGTIWSRIQSRLGIKAKDELYKLYGQDKFKDLDIDQKTDPELYAFVEETKARGPKFSNYSHEKIDFFVSRIYELRKNNSNNTAG
jgi:hypothetical protein